METIWKLYKACTLPMITYGSEAWIMNNQEKKQIQSINNKNLRTILTTPDTTPGIALRTETTLADISQEIDIKQINYLLKQMNRGTNEHISNSIWERKINTVCTHHNIDMVVRLPGVPGSPRRTRRRLPGVPGSKKKKKKIFFFFFFKMFNGKDSDMLVVIVGQYCSA